MENSVSDVLTSVLSICSETQKKKNLVRRRTLIHFRSWSWVLFLFSTRSTTELGEKRAKAFTMTFLTFHRTKKKNNKKSIGGRNWLKLGKVKAVQRLVNQPININLLCVCVSTSGVVCNRKSMYMSIAATLRLLTLLSASKVLNAIQSA